MPNALKIYRIQASPFWQVRLFVDRRLKRKTTGCDDRRDAIAFAKIFMIWFVLLNALMAPRTPKRFMRALSIWPRARTRWLCEANAMSA